MANNSSFAQQGATPLSSMFKSPLQGGGYNATPTPSSSISGMFNSPLQGGGYNPQTAVKGLLDQYKTKAPVKKIVSANGDQVHFDTTSSTKTGTNTPTPLAPPKITNGQYPSGGAPAQVSTNPASQIQNVGNAGQQTSNEAQTQQALQQSGQATPLEQEYINRVQEAQGMKNAGALGQYSNAGMLADQSPEGLYNNLVGRSGLSADKSADAGLYGQFSNIYGSQATQGLAAANTIAGRGTQAAQGAYSGAQTQAQRGLTAQTSVLGAGLPTQVSPTNVPFNPLTGTYGQPASSAYGTNGLAGVGGLLEQQNQGAQTQNMIGAFNQAKPLIETAKQQIESAGFNVNPLGLANALNQWVNKDVVPSGEYANIFNTLSEIATTISPVLGAQGAQTNLKTMIAQEFIPRLMQGSQISSVLDNIEKNALAKIEAQKSTAQGTPLKTPTLGAQGGGTITWDNIGD